MLRNLFILAFLPSLPLLAQDPVRIALEPFATGLTSPVDIAHCGDERLFVVEQPGLIRIVDPAGIVSETPFLDIQDRVNDNGNEQGLLGLAFDPEYATSGEFYVHYIAGAGNGTSRVSRFHVTDDANIADPTSEEILYHMAQPASNHNGGDIAFGPDGYLYFGLGDGGSHDDPNNNGQNLTNYAAGDMVRIDVDSGTDPYSIPATNPWVNVGNDTLPEIWASGLRNPWRFGFDAVTGDLWIGDVGQDNWEEVDFWPAGDNSGPNFGWRCREGLVVTPTAVTTDCPDASAFVDPVSVHSHDDGWCSVIGGRVYRGAEFPHLYGHYVYTDYCPAPYYSLTPDGMGGFARQEVNSSNGGVGTSCIAENSALELFVANVETGTVKRIVDACPMDAPVITESNGVLTSTPALTYAWFLNGEAIPDATLQSFTPELVGSYTVLAGFEGECAYTSAPVEVVGSGVTMHNGPSFAMHPSPARDMVTLSGLPITASKVHITDLSGRVVLTQQLNGKDRSTLDISSLASASYTVVVIGVHGELLNQRLLQVQR